MKKYFFVLVIFLIMMVTVSAKGVDNKAVINNLNSHDLLEYLKENNLSGKTIKVCNQDYCDYLKYKNLDKAVKIYIDDYIEYVKEKTDEETSVRVSLKGFLIKEISYS